MSISHLGLVEPELHGVRLVHVRVWLSSLREYQTREEKEARQRIQEDASIPSDEIV